MLRRLITALLDEQCDVDSLELADALWLLQQTGIRLAPVRPPDQPLAHPETKLDDEQPDETRDVEPSPQTNPTQRPAQPGQGSARGAGPRPASLSGRSHGTEGQAHGALVSTPVAAPLPQAREITRALRPLARRVPSRTQMRLDEQATARRTAGEGLLLPVLRPTQVRWLAIDIVADMSPSMLIWRGAVLELRRLLIRMGAFRDVRLWSLNTTGSNLSLTAGLKLRQPNQRSLRELSDPTGRRLILIVSDCSSDGWRSGAVASQIEQWTQSTPVTIVQVLPEWLWERSALGAEAGASLRARSPAPLRRQLDLRLTQDWLLGPGDPPEGPRVPVVTLEPPMLQSWAKFVCGASDVWTPGYILDPAIRAAAPAPTPGTIPAEQRWRDFASGTSTGAQDLAAALAVAPLTFPVIRTIQAALLPDTGPAHIAEVVLGGLLRQETPFGQIEDPDAAEFEFHEGVRELLLHRQPAGQIGAALQVVSRYIADRAGQIRAAQATLALPGGPIDIPEGRRFADIQPAVLRRMGYGALAERLEKASQHTTINADHSSANVRSHIEEPSSRVDLADEASQAPGEKPASIFDSALINRNVIVAEPGWTVGAVLERLPQSGAERATWYVIWLAEGERYYVIRGDEFEQLIRRMIAA